MMAIRGAHPCGVAGGVSQLTVAKVMAVRDLRYCSLLCTPGVAAGGVAQLAVGKGGGEAVGVVRWSVDSVGL